MQQAENSLKNSTLSFIDFAVESGGNTVINHLNLELRGNCDVLLHSRNKNISIISGLFVFNIFNDVKLSGKLYHNGTDIVKLINKIRKFRINGNRIGMTAHLMGDIFSIPSNPTDLFDPEIEVSNQVLDFIPYQARIEILNAIIRREMIKLTEIRDIIRDFDTAHDKKAYTITTSMNFGVLHVNGEMYKILNSGSVDRENLLASLIIGEKTGVNLADIVMLRNYYRYRLDYDGLTGEVYKANIERRHDAETHKMQKSMKKMGKKDFDFMGFRIARPYSEGILKKEVLKIIKNYANLIGITYIEEAYENFPADIPVLELYKLMISIAFITGKNILVIDLSIYPAQVKEIAEYAKRLKTLQDMACIYLCTDEYVARNRDKIFDQVVNL